MLKKKAKRNVALLIDRSVVLLLITMKYGISPTKIKRVNGKGNGVNEIPRIIPEKIKSSPSFLICFFSSGVTGVLYFDNNFKLLISFF
jgi:hypothetical protein